MVKLFSFGVVLTGGIATGKSTIAHYLKEDGFSVIDADAIAHETLDEETLDIVKIFGKDILNDQKIDRKKLGNIVFNDTQKRKELENILHPIILQKITISAQEKDKLKKLYFIDIPLFFETKNYDISKVLVVGTSKEEQLKRLMLRNNYSTKEAQLRINTQLSIEEKEKMATYLIDNRGTIEALKENYKTVIKEIEGDFNENH